MFRPKIILMPMRNGVKYSRKLRSAFIKTSACRKRIAAYIKKSANDNMDSPTPLNNEKLLIFSLLFLLTSILNAKKNVEANIKVVNGQNHHISHAPKNHGASVVAKSNKEKLIQENIFSVFFISLISVTRGSVP